MSDTVENETAEQPEEQAAVEDTDVYVSGFKLMTGGITVQVFGKHGITKNSKEAEGHSH